MNPHVRTHAVAAVRQDADWTLLDSQHPGVAHRLHCAALACSFDAEVVYLVAAEGEGQVLSAAAVRLALGAHCHRPSVAAPRPPLDACDTTRPDNAAREARSPLADAGYWPPPHAWPTAHCTLEQTAAPVQLLLFAPSNIVRSRPAFLKACTTAGLHALAFAKFNTECDNHGSAHLRLTVFLPSHAGQIRAQMASLRVYIRQHVGWHITMIHVPRSAPPRNSYTDAFGFHLPSRQNGRPRMHAPPPHCGFSLTPDPFEMLSPPDTQDDAAGAAADNAIEVLTSAQRSTPRRSRQARRAAQGEDVIGTLNVRDLGTQNALGRLTALAI